MSHRRVVIPGRPHRDTGGCNKGMPQCQVFLPGFPGGETTGGSAYQGGPGSPVVPMEKVRPSPRNAKERPMNRKPCRTRGES